MTDEELAAELMSAAVAKHERWQALAAESEVRRKAAEEAEAKRKAEEEEAEAKRKAEEEERKRIEAEERKRIAKGDRELAKAYDRCKKYPEALEILRDDQPHDIYEAVSVALSGHKILLNNDGARRGYKHETGLGEGERKRFFRMFATRENGGISIARLAEDIVQEICDVNGIRYDNNDARGIIIEMLASSDGPSDIYNYIRNRRIEQANSIVDHYEYEEECSLREEFWHEMHMTPEEWDVYNDYREEELKELDNHFRDFDFSEHYANIAERIEKDYVNGKDINRKGESDAEGGGDQSNVPVGTLVRGEGLPKEGSSGEVSTGFENVKKDLLRSSDHGERLDREATGEGSDVGIGQAERGNGGKEPTEAEKEAGNYMKGNVSIVGKTDNQGNPLNADGTLKLEKITSIDELRDEDFSAPTRNVELPALPRNVDEAIGANGKPVIIKKNIFERNAKHHAELTAEDSRNILQSALYNANLYGQNQKAKRPYNWVVINTKDKEGNNRLVLIELSSEKENAEIVHWYYLRDESLETIKRQAEREGGHILILPSEGSEEAGGLSSRTPDLSSDGKGNTLSSEKQGADAKNGDGVEDYAEMDEYVPQTWDENSSLRDVEARLKLLEDAFYYPWEALGKKIFPEYIDFINEKGDLKDKYGSGDKVPKEEADALFAKYAGYIERYNAMREEIYSLRELRDRLEAKMSREQKEEESRREMAELLAKHNGYLRGMSNLRMWNVDRYLSKLKKIDGEVATVSEFIDRWLADGSLRISKREYKPQIDRRKWNQMSGQEQAAWEASHNKPKTEYLVNDYDLGKTAYDYARWLMSQKKKGKLGDVVKEQKAVGAEEVSPREAALRDSLVGVLRDAGVEVVTDVEEGQRVLDSAEGSDVRMQAMFSNLRNAVEFIKSHLKKTRGGQFEIFIPESVNKRVEQRLGHAVKQHMIDVGGMNHGYNNHGENGRKLRTGDIPLTKEDMELAPYILMCPDKVVLGSQNNGIASVLYIKYLSNGRVVYIEAEGNIDGTVLVSKNMWANADPHKLSPRKVVDARQNDAPKLTSGNVILKEDAAKIRKDAEDAIRNDEKIRQHKVYHGSGADFDAFDNNHMSEGEGAQAYGWGTYVTEVEAIGRNYAIVNNNSLRKSKLESDIYRLKEALPFRRGEAKREGEEELKRLEEELSKFNTDWRSVLYTVEIPDDTGSNYLHWDKPVGREKSDKISKALYDRILREDKDGSYEDEYSRAALRRELDSLSGIDGKDLYGTISTYLGGDKAASEFLRDNGFVGVSYPSQFRSGGRKDGARNYVVFDEKDMEITDKVKFFRRGDGEAYGYTVDGKIYIDPRIATAETPIHEYSHLWSAFMRKANPKAWGDIVKLMKDCTDIWDQVARDYPELKTEDDIAEEVLTHYSGRRGAERLRAEMQRAMESAGKDVKKQVMIASMFEGVRRALSRFWRGVADLFHIRFTSAEDVADRVLADMLNGFNPVEAGKKLGARAWVAEVKDSFERYRGRNPEARQLSLFDDDSKVQPEARQLSLFDDTEVDGSGRIIEPERQSEMDRNAEKVNSSLDEFTDEYAEYLRLLDETEGSEDFVPEEAEARVMDLRDKLVEDMMEYHRSAGMGEAEARKRSWELVNQTMTDINIALLRKGKSGNIELLPEETIKVKRMNESEEAKEWLPELGEGEFCYMERKFSEDKSFVFSAPEHIESMDDVAYIFKQLEKYSVEHSFLALVKDGKVTVVHLGMGNATSAIVNMAAARAALDKFDPDMVYFVHNHPSGVLTASIPDVDSLQTLRDMTKGKVECEALIIDTLSGKYAQFGLDGKSRILDLPKGFDNEVDVKVQAHDKMEYAPDFTPDNKKQVLRAESVAKYVSSLRVGTGDKVGVLVMNQQNHILANLYLPMEEDMRVLGDDIAGKVVRFGGNRVIVYTNNGQMLEVGKALEDAIKRRSGNSVRLLDVLRLKKDGDFQALSESVFEADEEYGDKVRYNMGDGAETFADRQRRAVENKGTVMPGLNSAVVKVVEVPRHSYTGNIAEATQQAIEAAKAKYAPNGEPKTLHYDNFGVKFDYTISGNALKIVLSPKHQGKSVNKGSHLALAEHLDNIIGNSIEVEEHPDRIKIDGARGDSPVNPNALMHRFYGLARIDGAEYRVMTLMREDSRYEENNGIHSYEVQTIEVLDEKTPSTSNGEGTPNSELEAYPVAKLIKDVVKTMDSGKKVLAESRKADSFEPISTNQVDMRLEAERLSAELNTPVRIITDAEGAASLPTVRQRRAKGFWSEKDGIVVILSNHKDVADVAGTVLHEIVGHNGLRVLFPLRA